METTRYTCPICFDVFENPRALPCIHTFCAGCLSTYLQTQGVKSGAKFSCPICKAVHVLPDGGVENIPTNPYVQDSEYGPKPKTAAGGETDGGYCVIHERELCFYCNTCELTACNKCFLTEHKEHRIIDFKEKVSQEKEKIKILLITGIDIKTSMLNYKAALHQVCDDIQMATSRNIMQIEKRSEVLIQQLKNCTEEMKMKVEMHKFRELKKIENIESELANKIGDMEQVQGDLERVLTNSSGLAVLDEACILLGKGNFLFAAKDLSHSWQSMEFKPPVASYNPDWNRIFCSNVFGTVDERTEAVCVPALTENHPSAKSVCLNDYTTAAMKDCPKLKTAQCSRSSPPIIARKILSENLHCEKVHAMCTTDKGEVAILSEICNKVLIRTYLRTNPPLVLNTRATKTNTSGFQKMWECFIGEGHPCDITEVLTFNQPHFAVTYPSTHEITIISRDKKATVAYRRRMQIPTIMRKFPQCTEDVYALEEKPINDRCIVHVLDCSKSPWRKVNDITLQTNHVSDFSIVDSTPSNLIITTNAPAKLLQGFTLSTGEHLWNLKGEDYRLHLPLKLHTNHKDKIYVTDEKLNQIHIISSTGIYRQLLETCDFKSIGSILVHNRELLVAHVNQTENKLEILNMEG